MALALRITAAAVASLVASAHGARAQPAGNVPLDTFHPAMDSRGYITVNASQTLGDREVSFGLGALDWGHGLLDLDANGKTYGIDDIVQATLIAAFGLHVGPAELEFGASVPLSIMSGDRGPEVVDPMDANHNQAFQLDGQGLGNIALHVKTRLLKTSRGPHLGLGLLATVYLPTVTASDRFLGDGKLVPEVMGILDKELGAQRRLRLALNGGLRLRASQTFTNSDPGELGAPVTGRSVTVGDEVPFGAAIAYAVAPQKLELVGEVYGSLPLGASTNYQPLEALGGIKLYIARNSFLSLGGGRGLATTKGASPDARAFIGIVFEPNIGDRDGDGIKDDVDQCPDAPEDKDGFEDEDGCPDPDNDRDGIPDTLDKCPNVPGPPPDGCPVTTVGDRDGDGIPDNVDKCPDDPEDFDGFQDEDGCPDPDNDGDGILDVDDLCPNDPEDKDGFEDEDGCPDPDNDKDGIPDKLDKCPNEPETYNGVEDEDGCPDRGPVITTSSKIVPLEPINFEYNQAIISKDSFHILDAVVAAMKGNPDIQKVEIQGHTDERGDDAYNLDLSDRRAAAVRTYLTEHGVAPARLVSQGYGETQPIDTAHNEQAWAKNRRVEFLILQRTE